MFCFEWYCFSCGAGFTVQLTKAAVASVCVWCYEENTAVQPRSHSCILPQPLAGLVAYLHVSEKERGNLGVTAHPGCLPAAIWYVVEVGLLCILT